MSRLKERTQNILKVYQYLHEKKLIEDKAAKKDRRKLLGKSRSLENTNEDIILMMN